MPKKSLHVVPRESGWRVRKTGSARATGVYTTQAEAIDAATRIARDEQTELYIHDRNGRIRERTSYSGDLMSRKG